MYDFVLGLNHSHPGLHVAHGLQVGHPRQNMQGDVSGKDILPCCLGMFIHASDSQVDPNANPSPLSIF